MSMITSLVIDSPSERDDKSVANNSSITGGSIFDLTKRRERNRETLDITLHGLQARQEECQTLLDTYHRVRETHCFECILVKGEAGTGKTQLVETLRRPVAEDGGYYVSANFHQATNSNNNKEPYPALASCFSEICDLVLQQVKEHATLEKTLVEEIGNFDFSVLSRIVSGVSHLIPQVIAAEERREENSIMATSFDKFKRQCIVFLEIVTSVLDHPVVIFLDDIQCADEESIEVIHSLVDRNISNLFVVGSFITSEEGEHKQILPLLGDVTYVHLTDLGQDHVNALVAEILELEIDQVESLARIFYQKTSGNPGAIIQYLQLLVCEGLLEFSAIQNQWTWDDTKIQSETDITNPKFLDLVVERVHHLDKELREVLTLTSCIGFVFETKVLKLLVREIISKDIDLSQILNEASEQKFLEQTNSGSLDKAIRIRQIGVSSSSYKWSHERIQKSFQSLMTSHEKATMHLNVGKTLLLNKSHVNWTNSLQFLVVDQFNDGISCVHDDEELLRIVEMNLAAGDRSIARSDFGVACTYLLQGVAILRKQKDAWKNHYDMTIAVFTRAVEAAHSTGEATVRTELVEEILLRAQSLDDKLIAYNIRVDALGMQGLLNEALDAGHDLLSFLKEKFPKRPGKAHVISQTIKTKLALQNMSDREFLGLPILENNRVHNVMQVLSNLHRYAFQFESFEFACLLSLRLMRLSLQYGVCAYSSHAFASYAMILVGQEQYKEAHRFGKLALRLMMKVRSQEMEARTLVLVYGYVNHFQQPVDEASEHLLRAYQSGISVGDVGYSMLGATHYCLSLYCTGVSLDCVEDEVQKYSNKMVDLGERNSLSLVTPLFQTAQNLRGKSEDPASLSGDLLDTETAIRQYERDGNEMALITTCHYAFVLACYFDSFVLAGDYLETIKSSRNLKSIQPHFLYFELRLFTGLYLYATYRLCSLRHYKNKARKLVKQMNRDIAKGIVAYTPMVKFLQAEETSLSGDFQTTLDSYDAAIRLMDESGLVQYSALACEKAGNVMLERFGCQREGGTYYAKATERYLRWNAYAKVDHVKRKAACNRQVSAQD